jgi:IS5 family transposase
MVYFRKRLPEAVVNGCNERIVRHGLKVICSSVDHDPGGDDGSGGGSTSTAGQPQPLPRKQTNQGSLLIDATCAPGPIRSLSQ